VSTIHGHAVAWIVGSFTLIAFDNKVESNMFNICDSGAYYTLHNKNTQEQ